MYIDLKPQHLADWQTTGDKGLAQEETTMLMQPAVGRFGYMACCVYKSLCLTYKSIQDLLCVNAYAEFLLGSRVFYIAQYITYSMAKQDVLYEVSFSSNFINTIYFCMTC